MRYYFAPLEGLTDGIFRRLHHKYFPGVGRYYTPFFSPASGHLLTARQARELPDADTTDFTVIPQILTKNPEDFTWFAGQCAQRGYREVNLNLGCPSGTVTAKGKGSAMLRDLDALDRFLEGIFANAPVDISIKTRIGFDSAEEFPAILQILNRYPIGELTVHPRVRGEFYKGTVHMDVFSYTLQHSRAPVCYNGDLYCVSQIQAFSNAFPQIDAVMLGRGLIGDPGMLTPGGTTAASLELFFEELLEAYLEAFGGSRNAMFRLKEHWQYLIRKFEGSEKLGKQLRKTTDLSEYKAITAQIFHTLPLKEELPPGWLERV